jgi:N6-adenosine-specific RNA methylase IME4
MLTHRGASKRTIDVIEAWRFKYATGAVWVKPTRDGKGGLWGCFWWRGNAELCLLATRGKPK